MGVTTTPGGTANSSKNEQEAVKNTHEKMMKNGHDKENDSANRGVSRTGNDENDDRSPSSSDNIEIGANMNVSKSSKYYQHSIKLYPKGAKLYFGALTFTF